MNYRRFFRFAGLTLQVEAELPITDSTFSRRLMEFEAEASDGETVLIRHHFGLPDLSALELGNKVHEDMYLSVYRNAEGWVFINTTHDLESKPLRQVSFVDPLYQRVDVFNDREEPFKKGNLHMLSFHHNDLLFLTEVINQRMGCMFHSSGVILDGGGYLFVGHSGAGKSTMVKMLMEKVEVLCDDRNVVRRMPDGLRLFGTWNHGEVPVISPKSAPLRAVMLLKKAEDNCVCPQADKAELAARLAACTIKPMATASWWQKTLSLVGEMLRALPCHYVEFDRSGRIYDVLLAFDASIR